MKRTRFVLPVIELEWLKMFRPQIRHKCMFIDLHPFLSVIVKAITLLFLLNIIINVICIPLVFWGAASGQTLYRSLAKFQSQNISQCLLQFEYTPTFDQLIWGQVLNV